MAETLAAAAPAEGKKKLPILKILIAVVVIGGLFALFKVLPVKEWIENLKVFVRGQGSLGYVIFGLVYIAASLIPGGPAAILTLTAGAVYGVVTGTILVSIASTLAATIAFFLARFVFQEKVQKMTAGNAKFKSLNKAIEKQGAKIVALVRLSPIFPFTFINYAFGLTPVKALSYVLASWIAMLPGTLAYVYFGSAAGDLAGGADPKQKAIKLTLGVAAIVATIFIARIAAKAIKNAGVEDAPKAQPTPAA